MIDPDANDFSDWADYNAQEFKGYTDYSQNFQASVGQVFDEELSISSRMDVNRDFINPFTNPVDFMERLYEVGGSDRKSRRNDSIKKLVDTGKIPKEIFDQFSEPAHYRNKVRGTKTDWNGIAEYVNENKLFDYELETDEIMQNRVNTTLDQRRKYREDVFSKATTAGEAARFLGGMTAGGLDPIAVVTMPIAPLSVAKNLSRTMYTAAVAGRSAALNIGLQAPIEPLIHSWKEDIGAEYTVADSMFNLAAAGIFGGTLSGVAANLGHKFTGDSFLSKNRDVLKKQFKKAGFDDADADVLSEYQADINNAPDKNVSTESHIQRGEENLEKLNQHKNSDYDSEPVTKEQAQITEEYEKSFGEQVDTEGKVIEPDPSKELYYDLGGEKVSVRTVVDDYGVDIESASKIMECLFNA